MKKIMFNDLVFKDHLAEWEEQAIVDFDNGYGVSVGKTDTDLYDVIVFRVNPAYDNTISMEDIQLNLTKIKVDLILLNTQNKDPNNVITKR